MRRLGLGAVVVLFAGAGVQAGELTATFIGNAAFHISDGTTAILTDFPYDSGAFGYMEWSRQLVPAGPKPLCLFTHAHRDHFAPEQAAGFCDVVVGPGDVLGQAGVRRLTLERPVRWKGITIRATATPHGPGEHYSYLVEWQGWRLYFSGDTDDTAMLLEARDLDVAFVTPWLIEKLARGETRLDARRIVTHHHKPGEAVAQLQGRLVPAQGDVLRFPARAATVSPVPTAPDSIPLPAVPRTAEDDGFSARFREASRNVEAGAGREYKNGAFSQRFYQLYPTLVSACMQQAPGTEPANFDLAIRLAADGRVEAALVRPRSKLATCFADSVARETFAAPPAPAFWVPVGVTFTKE